MTVDTVVPTPGQPVQFTITASNVFLDLSQAPASIPGVRFGSAGCTATRCTVSSIAVGSQAALHWISDDFKNKQQHTATFAFATSSSDVLVFTDCSDLVRMLLTPLVLAIAFPLLAMNGSARVAAR